MKESNIHQLGGERAWDSAKRDIMLKNTLSWKDRHETARKQFSDLELARSRASQVREHVIFKLENYLKDFESRFNNSGGKVIWAPEEKNAIEAITNIINEHKAEVIVKSRSAVTDEINLTDHVRKNGSKVYETDMGDFILDLDSDEPSHVRHPSIHLDENKVKEIFHKNLETEEDASSDQLNITVTEFLRKKLSLAGVAVTGADFLLANTGSIVLSENEGNQLLSTTKPKVHIVVAGIEQVLPGPEDLSLFLPLLGTYATGVKMNVYNHIISAPEKEKKSGRTKMFVILLDNGRSKVLADEKIRPLLKCIQCGACANVCPVFNTIGGNAYGTDFQGPFGAIFEPAKSNYERNTELPFASTLCGKCTDVCPVNIDLHKMLLYARKNVIENKKESSQDRRAMRTFRYLMYKRKRLERSHGLRKTLLGWHKPKHSGKLRVPQVPAEKSFSQLWNERQESK